MITARINGKQAAKVLSNVVAYTDGYIKETKARQPFIARKLADTSIDAFYNYLDTLARSHPGMYHHVYEWGSVGNPTARLYELTRAMKGNGAIIGADFLESTQEVPNSDSVFYDKARVMEEGITVVVDTVEADALFFEINGEEFFRAGPIVIANPGGDEVRGAFVAAFNEFYATYFEDVYLKAIKYYDHLEKMREYERGLGAAARSGNASALGRKTALSWIMNLPGDDYDA